MTWADYMRGRLDDINVRLKVLERKEDPGKLIALENLSPTRIDMLWLRISDDSTGSQSQALN